MQPIEIIGEFRPSAFDNLTIDRELRTWLNARGIHPTEFQIGVRSPQDTRDRCAQYPFIMEWHRDTAGDIHDPTITPSVKHLVLWSNGTQTRLKTGLDGPEFVARPFDVVLIDNFKVWHCSPPPEENRYWIGIDDPIIDRN